MISCNKERPCCGNCCGRLRLQAGAGYTVGMHPLLDPFERQVDQRPEQVAVGDPNLILDYRALRAIAAGLAGRIDAATDKAQVGVLAPTSTAAAVAIVACYYAGRVPTPLNFLHPPEALARIVADADLDLVLSVELFAPMLAALPVRGLMLGPETLTPGQRQPPSADPAAQGALLYTSGTAGDPKGVCLSLRNLAANASASIEHFQLHADHTFLNVLPPFHAFGYTLGVLAPLTLGASTWCLPRFSPMGVLEAIAARRVTIFPAVASMFAALVGAKQASRNTLETLELPVSGGEPLPLPLADAFRSRFGRELLEGYGLTETSPVVTGNTPDAHRPGSVGQPIPGVSVRAVDERGARLPPDAEGELVVSGHCVMTGYRNQPQATARTIRGGDLYTGDIGRIDANGFVYVTGRAKEMIIVGGENVFPREIEAVLGEHPAVAEAAVIGQKDAVRGEVPVAYVVLREAARGADGAAGAGDGALCTELRSLCQRRLGRVRAPREVIVVADLPRGPTGKVLKRALKTRP